MTEISIDQSSFEEPAGFLIKLTGRLDIFNYLTLKSFFERYEEDPHGIRLVVDMTAVEHVASSGWGVLVARSKLLHRLGGGLVVLGMNDGLQKVYDTMNLETLLPIADDLETAKGILREVP